MNQKLDGSKSIKILRISPSTVYPRMEEFLSHPIYHCSTTLRCQVKQIINAITQKFDQSDLYV